MEPSLTYSNISGLTFMQFTGKHKANNTQPAQHLALRQREHSLCPDTGSHCFCVMVQVEFPQL